MNEAGEPHAISREMADSRGDRAGGRQAAAGNESARAYELLRRADSAEPLGAADLELFATGAYLVGNVRDTLDGLQRAHHAYPEDGEVRRAAHCLFWLVFILMSQGVRGDGTR